MMALLICLAWLGLVSGISTIVGYFIPSPHGFINLAFNWSTREAHAKNWYFEFIIISAYSSWSECLWIGNISLEMYEKEDLQLR